MFWPVWSFVIKYVRTNRTEKTTQNLYGLDMELYFCSEVAELLYLNLTFISSMLPTPAKINKKVILVKLPYSSRGILKLRKARPRYILTQGSHTSWN